MDHQTVFNKVKILTERAEKLFAPAKVYLFGSYSNNRATAESDVDVLVVSPHFAGLAMDERFDALYQLTYDLYPDFHVIGYTPIELKRASKLSTLGEIRRTARPVANL